MGTCDPETIQLDKQQNIFLYGNILTIRDFVDGLSGSCEELFAFSEGKIARHEEIVLHVGTGHGILYKPLDEWILPAVQWAEPMIKLSIGTERKVRNEMQNHCLAQNPSPDLAEQYTLYNKQLCDALAEGQEFIVTNMAKTPDGFCVWAWLDIQRWVRVVMRGRMLTSVFLSSMKDEG